MYIYISYRHIAVCRQCAVIVSEGDSVYEALLPSSHIINSVLQYVWALWEDPVDVSYFLFSVLAV